MVTKLISAFWFLASMASAQTLLFLEPGDAAGDRAGSAVAMVGDVDADGADDFAVGSPRNDAAGASAGMLRVHSGRTGQPLHTWYGGAANEQFGCSVAGAGDVDGDGHADVVVGAQGGDYADVLSGQTGLPLYRLTGVADTGFGHAVAGGGQVDGDGVPDILVGAPGCPFSPFCSIPGELHVFSGASGSSIRSHPSPNGLAAAFGWSASFYGDLDGDARDEYAVGDPGWSVLSAESEVFAYDGATGAFLWSSVGGHNDQLGWSLAPLADVTGDAIAEVIAGAPGDPGIGCGGCNGKGYVRLLDGATGGQVWQVQGVLWFGGLGYSVRAVGDVDLDGQEDLAASQPATDFGGWSFQTQIRSGSTGALILELDPPTAGTEDRWGYSLASGDANDDGLRDVLVGAPDDDAGGVSSGATYAYTVVQQPTAYCAAQTNSQGCLPMIYSTGLPSFTANTFRVRARDVINNKSGLLFWGLVPAAKPFQGGTRCVSPPVVRTGLQSSGGNPPPDDCSGMFAFHFSGNYMTSKGLQAGTQVYCQYWSRDPAGASGTNLTDALAFLVEP